MVRRYVYHTSASLVAPHSLDQSRELLAIETSGLSSDFESNSRGGNSLSH
jgi:hypothetical protein